ncbi:hypothetical protein [Okeania sp. SIO2B3]|uniref:hypothetical protein n=1 Tax=Okeania sp. SIO2B3 TaxID=2607784 RepID=UPI0013C01BF6|nr:hypothetical protein [Okeania sp. SIO2B3]NET46973.1 hypothetical protein [Okeania sp. SIO2B3]
MTSRHNQNPVGRMPFAPTVVYPNKNRCMMGLFNFEYFQTRKINNKRSPHKKFTPNLSRKNNISLSFPSQR